MICWKKKWEGEIFNLKKIIKMEGEIAELEDGVSVDREDSASPFFG